MARQYTKQNVMNELAVRRGNIVTASKAICFVAVIICVSPLVVRISPFALFFLGGVLPMILLGAVGATWSQHIWIEKERRLESKRRGGKPVLGLPPQRTAFEGALADIATKGKVMIDRYLVGFELDSGEPIWVTDDDLCSHACVFAKTGVGKTLWLEGLMAQQMARGRASGFTFIDAKRDSGTLADIIMMSLITGRIEDLIVVDPFDPVCSYNFVFTTQRPDVKARKVLRCGLPPTSDASVTKHYDRLAADAVYRVVRAMESLGLAWSVRDVAVALSQFNFAYPRLRTLLMEKGEKQAMIELGHLAGSYRSGKGKIDGASITDNLRGISSELHSISNSEAGEMFCIPKADLSLTDAISRGKIIYYMLPRLEEAESAARMVKVFREDLEVSIGEITSNRDMRLEDPHIVMVDEGASTFGPTWANLFELARKGRFALIFGAQSVGGLMDETMGLSEQFYERVIANVNLKVIMRVGDNRTAMDMSEWIGKVSIAKKSVSSGLTSGIAAHELTKNMEINRKSSESYRDAITISDDEEDLVSPEELKHEMSAEKGLAWFDKGDGKLRKGRAIWFDSALPGSWEGREFLTRYESVEADEIGLAEWVDEHILSIERSESERENGGSDFAFASGGNDGPGGGGGRPGQNGDSREEKQPEADAGPFRLNLFKNFRGKGRGHTSVVAEEGSTSEKTDHNTSNSDVGGVSEQASSAPSPSGKSSVTASSNGPEQRTATAKGPETRKPPAKAVANAGNKSIAAVPSTKDAPKKDKFSLRGSN